MLTLSISCSEADAEKRRYCCKGLACGTVARLEAAGHDKIRGMDRFQQAAFRWLALLGLAATAVVSLAADSGLRAQAAALKARGDAAGGPAFVLKVAGGLKEVGSGKEVVFGGCGLILKKNIRPCCRP